MVDEHNGIKNAEEEITTLPEATRLSIQMGIFATALIGATIAVLMAPKSWRSSTGGVARSAGTRIGPSVRDMRQHLGPGLRSVSNRVGPMAEVVASRIGRGLGRSASNGAEQP